MRRAGERGSAVVVAMMAMVVVLALGLALLAVADTQTQASAASRAHDTAFDLAETALTSEAFVLGRTWPAYPADVPPNTCATGFGATLAQTPAAGTPAAKLQSAIRQAYPTSSAPTGQWMVQLCDDSSPTWNPAQLAQPPYDANRDKLLWVRATAWVQGRATSVASLVRVGTSPAFTRDYGLIAGKLTEDLSGLLSQVTGGLVGSLLGTEPLVSGAKVGIRCGVLDITNGTCVSGGVAGLASSALPAGVLADYDQYSSPSATTPETVAQLREQATDPEPGGAPTYVDLSPGSNVNPPACRMPLPAGPPEQYAQRVVFIEQVGNGDESCVIDVGHMTRSFAALVVGRGRVIVRGDGATRGSTLHGVVYALDAQGTTDPVVTLDQGAHVVGAVQVDGGGSVSIKPPGSSGGGLIGDLLGGLRNTLGDYLPAIVADPSTIEGAQVYSSSSAPPGSFAQVAPPDRASAPTS